MFNVLEVGTHKVIKICTADVLIGMFKPDDYVSVQACWLQSQLRMLNEYKASTPELERKLNTATSKVKNLTERINALELKIMASQVGFILDEKC
jgi:hypothetical protein